MTDALFKAALDGSFDAKPRAVFGARALPHVMGPVATLAAIADGGCSIARFGDGELRLALSRSGGPRFQDVDAGLCDELLYILSGGGSNGRLLVGLNRAHLYRSPAVAPGVDVFADNMSATVADADAFARAVGSGTFAASEITVAWHHYTMTDDFWRSWFGAWEAFFSRRRVMLVTGSDDPRNVALYRACAREMRFVPCPMRNAWRERGRILADVRRLNADRSWTVALACGPAATVFARDLSRDGMVALDLGHLSAEWSDWKTGAPRWEVCNFYGR